MEQKTMLIIEDDRATRDALQRLFISRGWEVAMVTSQAEALVILDDYEPAWIVIPWELLEGTGERFVCQMRSKSPSPRLLLLTDTTDGSSWRLARRLKPDVHFKKPLIPEDVFRACMAGVVSEVSSAG